MRRTIPAILSTTVLLGTIAACEDTIAYASGCTQHIAIGGNTDTDTHSRNVPGAPRTSIRITYPADVFNRASRPIAERQIRSAANQAWARGCHITIWAYSLGASAASTVTDSWIRYGARGTWNVRDAICSMPAPWTRDVAQSADHIVGYFGTQHRYR